jgi:hypothetical protein
MKTKLAIVFAAAVACAIPVTQGTVSTDASQFARFKKKVKTEQPVILDAKRGHKRGTVVTA